MKKKKQREMKTEMAKTSYIIIESEIEAGRKGKAELLTRFDEMELSDEEIVAVREFQSKAAKELEEILKK